MRFFGNYQGKEDGSIRFYDVKSKKTKFWLVMIYIACFAIALIALYPVFWLICSSLKNLTEYLSTTQILPKDPDWTGWIKTWNDFGFTKYYINSGIAVAGGVLCAVFFNGLMAYVLAVLKPKGHKIILALVMWCLLIPPTTSFVALFVNIKKIGLTGSFVPLWLTMGANAYWVILFKNYFESLPKDYIDAARIDGCGVFGVFTRIVLPLSKPIIVVVAIFAITAAWSDFLMPFLLLSGTDKETVMVKLYSFQTSIKTNQIDIIRAVLYSIIPPTVLFALFQKQIMGGVMSGGIKG
ncbi:MAG TPA: carbohydrate ABC transporter permease [Clostridiales bacterium]|nr:carbohydrate ABC transporter permease [Clostridiales bacterium]HBK26612.1 carbohydrate ABC transporter permease [Clostridiales bacterium]HCP71142.1 carbohydrate ABC transporter permease [Clostridiales bacterium]